ncbi:unnamed protein product [Discula destructiva]
MAPHDGLVHPKEYDIKDSNVELIGTELDHKVKYNSAASEPAWNNGQVGVAAGLHIWRIEDFEVVPWPKDKYGQFYDGDSYIVLHTYKVGGKTEAAEQQQQQQQQQQHHLGHDVFFWLGAHTSQDEAGTAAYKTVELDEFLLGKATQHRELQSAPSDAFMELFPRVQIRAGGVRSGFTHVEQQDDAATNNKEEITTLLRVFQHPGAKRDSVVVHEVEPTWRSLDEDDVFVLDKGDKIYVWQGRKCSPMEKAKAAQVVHDMTLAKHVDTEVLSQTESRSRIVVEMLGGDKDAAPAAEEYRCAKPVSRPADGSRPKKLFKLSDASGQLSFGPVKEGSSISQSDLDGNDVFILDDAGKAIWVWQGDGASKAEKAAWLRVAQAYVRQLQGGDDQSAHLTPIAKVIQGSESPAFLRAVAV